MSGIDFRMLVRSTDPDTSFEAAGKVAPKLNKLQAEVLRFYRGIYPQAATDLDLQDHFDSHLSTYRTRRSELTRMELIADSGRRKHQAGANRVMWVAALPAMDREGEGGNALW